MSDQREPTWVDYSNLAFNIVQVSQLSSLNRRLNELALIEATREERFKIENELRQYIFETEELLDEIIPYKDIAPSGVYFFVSIFQKLIGEIGIEPATFQEFVDKDRVKNVKKKINTVLKHTIEQLSDDEVKKIQKCLIWAYESDELKEIISAQKIFENLRETQKEFNKLKKENKRKTTPWYIVIAISMILIFFGCIISNTIGNLNFDIHKDIALFLLLFFICLPIIPIIISTIYITRVDKREYIEFRDQRLTLIRQLPSKERLQYLRSKFGDLTYKEYESIAEERKLKCIRFVEYDKNGNLLEEPLDKIIARLQ